MAQRLVSALAALLVLSVASPALAAAAPSPRASHAAAAAPGSRRVGDAPAPPTGAQSLGPLAAATPLSITIALQPRDPVALAAYAAGVSTPGSSDYHRYLSVADFARRFGPTPATIAGVRASLRGSGLGVGVLSPNGLSLPVSANAAVAARAFSTSFRRYRLRGGRLAYANATAPALDAAIAGSVESVIGLDDLARARPLDVSRDTGWRPAVSRAAADGAGARVPAARPSATAHVTPCATASSVASSHGAYTADQLAGAYGFNALYAAGDQAAGQTIAIYELEGNFPGDINGYQGCYGTSAPVSYTIVAPGPTPPDGGNGDGIETELDVETAIGLAPQARIAVYQGANSGSGPYDVYNRIIGDDTAKVISTSWGECEGLLGASNIRAESTLFQEAAVQGQSIVAASGDDGVQDCYPGSTVTAVDDPASQPWVTGVGGTSLLLSPSRTETVWNNGASGAGASGGGDSALWTMPSWQAADATSLSTVNSQSSTTTCGAPAGAFCREVPDVSASADPKHGYVIDYGGLWGIVGGTSAASPLWSALLALANASGTCAGSALGFADPALYRSAATSYATAFNDVTSGNNDWQGLNAGSFSAGVGYDQATGLGTPNAAVLAPALCGQTLRLATPAAQSSVVLRAGTSLTLQSSDAPGQTVSFTATGLPPGLAISPATGVISGTPTAAGSFTPRVSATDSAGATASTTFSWTIVPATISLSAPAAQSTRVGRQLRLQLSAHDDNGQPVTFEAAGLPAGLSVNRSTGLISGTTRTAGVSTPTITAVAAGANPAQASFSLTVAAAPRATGASLRGVAAGRPRLRFTVSAGTAAPALRTITIRLPHGLAAVGNGRLLRRRVSVSGTGVSVSRAGGALRIALARAPRSVRITITAPALTASAGLRSAARRHRAGRLAVRVTVLDAAGASTALKLSVRPS